MSNPVLSAEDYEDLYENAPCGYLCIAPGGRIVRSNATIVRWLGYSPGALSDMRLSSILSIGSRMYWETHLGPLLKLKGDLDTVALDLLSAQGHKIPAFVSAAERRDAAGQIVLTRLTVFTAAERRDFERGLIAARNAAHQANDDLQTVDRATRESLRLERETAQLREQFIAVLGHDLRSPLAAIYSGVRLLREETLSDRATEILNLMCSTVRRMTGLIDNVLDFARGRLGGGLSLSRDASASLEPLLHQVVEEIRASAPEHVIEVAINLSEPVHCDRSRIGQLVSNLLGNAIIHGSHEQPVRLMASTAGKVLEISVGNGGAAIPPEAMKMLFQPFFRGEVRASQQGLGLGLYIAWEIATAHGGDLAVASSDQETRFTFRMPLMPVVDP
jgi:sigma-B regulation protein RsbU (phosphoserine phosphatase)